MLFVAMAYSESGFFPQHTTLTIITILFAHFHVNPLPPRSSTKDINKQGLGHPHLEQSVNEGLYTVCSAPLAKKSWPEALILYTQQLLPCLTLQISTPSRGLVKIASVSQRTSPQHDVHLTTLGTAGSTGGVGVRSFSSSPVVAAASISSSSSLPFSKFGNNCKNCQRKIKHTHTRGQTMHQPRQPFAVICIPSKTVYCTFIATSKLRANLNTIIWETLIVKIVLQGRRTMKFERTNICFQQTFREFNFCGLPRSTKLL